MRFPITLPLARLLAEMAAHADPARIDRAWIFPPRHHGDLETGLVVLSLRGEDHASAEMREVVTVRYEQRPGEKAATGSAVAAARGWAPADRVPGLIDGVLRRRGGEGEEPIFIETGGDTGVWETSVAAMLAGILDPTNGE